MYILHDASLVVCLSGGTNTFHRVSCVGPPFYNNQEKAIMSTGLSIKKSLFPVQRVANIVICLFGGNWGGGGGGEEKGKKEEKKVPSRP